MRRFRNNMQLAATVVVVLLLIFGFASLPLQSVHADSLKARFASDDEAQTFAAWAEIVGQGNRATISHNEDGSTSVVLPDVATEAMSEIALDAIDANATAIQVGPAIPEQVIDAIGVWFDGFQAEGNTALIQTSYSNVFEYGGNVSSAVIGFDYLVADPHMFYAYLDDYNTTIAEISGLDADFEEPIRAAIQAEATARGIPVITYP